MMIIILGRTIMILIMVLMIICDADDGKNYHVDAYFHYETYCCDNAGDNAMLMLMMSVMLVLMMLL